MNPSYVKRKNLPIQISLMAVMTALVAVGTFIIRIPNPMGGYFNVGDVMVFVAALTFNPLVGGFTGGVGSAISDMIGFPMFAVPTLIIKGLEGVLAGLITNRKSVFRDATAVVVAGSEMILGYFLVELYLPGWGLGGALAELPGNAAQIVIGGLLGIPIAKILRSRLPEIFKS
jgi:uncharacterized membrane protein